MGKHSSARSHKYEHDDGEKDSKIRKEAKRRRTWNIAFVFMITLFVYVCIDTELQEGEQQQQEEKQNMIKKNVRGLRKKVTHLKRSLNIPAMQDITIPDMRNVGYGTTNKGKKAAAAEEEGKVNHNIAVEGLTNLITSTSLHTPLLLPPQSLYRVAEVEDRYGASTVSMGQYAGMITLIVNVACKWGKTESTYRELIELQQKYAAQGFTVLAFPTNQFHQELGTNEEIKDFLDDKFPNINFPIMGLSDSLTSNKVYQNLQQQMPTNNVKWNFFKYLVDRKGQAVSFYDLNEAPIGPESRIMYDIDKLIIKQPYQKIQEPKLA